jgi:hypothetical protein
MEHINTLCGQNVESGWYILLPLCFTDVVRFETRVI